MRSAFPSRTRTLLAAALLFLRPFGQRARGEADYAFQPTADLDLDVLAALVHSRAPALADARLGVGLAGAELQRTHLLDNPTLDLAAGTIPLGDTNPPGLAPIDVPKFSEERVWAEEGAQEAQLAACTAVLAHTVRALPRHQRSAPLPGTVD